VRGTQQRWPGTRVLAPPRRLAGPHPQASARARAGGCGAAHAEWATTARGHAAAVTRYGYRRGVLRGVSASRGGSARAGTPVPRLRRLKRGEPHDRLRGATDPRRPDGASRQGGEEPRRRNVTRRVAASGRRGPWSPGVDIRARVGGEAWSERTPGEEGESPARIERFEGEVKLEGARTGSFGRQSRTPGKDLESHPLAGKAEEGAAKADELLPGRLRSGAPAPKSRPTP
jgi:hypothetical protein